MSELSNFELEGRLNAQRELIAMLMARLTDGPEDPLWAIVEQSLEVQNHQEDPGAVPDAAFTAEAEMAREFRLIVERAKSREARSQTG